MSDPLEKPTRIRSDQQAGDPVPPTAANSTDGAAPVSGHITDDDPPFRAPTHRGDLGRLGRYRIVKRLGKGGMGVVYLGYDDTMRRKVAIKVLPVRLADHPGARQRFLREARTAAAVSSEHIVTIIDVDEDNGIPFIAMEYLQGIPLDRYLTVNPPLTVQQIVRIGLEVTRGLAVAHEQGLVHRDIKPANLWLEAPHGRVKILDFGLAKETESGEEGSLTQTGQVVGTPAFMSPEQARGEPVTAATDLFSLGIVLYRVATGRLPFQGSTAMAVLMALGLDEPPPVRELNPAVPEPLAALIHQLLAKKVADRPSSAADVHAVLATLSGKRPRMETPSATVLPAPRAEPRVPSPPTPGPLPAPISVGVQQESVWDRIGMAEPAETSDAEPSGIATRKASGGVPWLVVAGLVLAVGISVAVLIAVIDWTKTKIEPDVVAPADPPPPTRVFFNGKNFNGWAAKDGYWKVDNGQITGAFPKDIKPVTTVVYARQYYRDFELSFQARLPTGGNSGLYFRAEPNKTMAFGLIGPECEFAPTDCGCLFLKPGERTAGPAPGEVTGLLKPNDFNQLTVRCVGKHVMIKLNGQVTVDGDFEIPPQGVIGWQLHELSAGHEVQIKDIQFTDLSTITSPR